MKSSTSKIACILLMLAITPVSYASIIKTEKTETPIELNSLQRQNLINRLEEIKSIDTKQLTRQEKRILKREKAAIQDVVVGNRRGNGLYISGGLIILILLLIIIL